MTFALTGKLQVMNHVKKCLNANISTIQNLLTQISIIKILNKVSARFNKRSPMFKMREHPYMYVYYHFELSELHNIDWSYLMSIATRLV